MFGFRREVDQIFIPHPLYRLPNIDLRSINFIDFFFSWYTGLCGITNKLNDRLFCFARVKYRSFLCKGLYCNLILLMQVLFSVTST